MQHPSVYRSVRIVIGFLLAFLGHVTEARAGLPIVVSPDVLEENKLLDVTLPAGIQSCQSNESKTAAVPKVTLAVNDVGLLREGKEVAINVTYDADCGNAVPETIRLAAIDITPKS